MTTESPRIDGTLVVDGETYLMRRRMDPPARGRRFHGAFVCTLVVEPIDE